MMQIVQVYKFTMVTNLCVDSSVDLDTNVNSWHLYRFELVGIHQLALDDRNIGNGTLPS